MAWKCSILTPAPGTTSHSELHLDLSPVALVGKERRNCDKNREASYPRSIRVDRIRYTPIFLIVLIAKSTRYIKIKETKTRRDEESEKRKQRKRWSKDQPCGKNAKRNELSQKFPTKPILNTGWRYYAPRNRRKTVRARCTWIYRDFSLSSIRSWSAEI